MVKRLQEIDILDTNKKPNKTSVKKIKTDAVEAPVVKLKVKKPPTEKQLAAVARMREARELKKQEKLKAEEDAINLQKKNERKLKRDEKLAKREATEKQMIVDSVKKEFNEEIPKVVEPVEAVVEPVEPENEEKVEVLKPLNSPVKRQNPPPIVPIKTAHRIWKAPKYEENFERGYKKMGQGLFGRPFHSGKRLH